MYELHQWMKVCSGARFTALQYVALLKWMNETSHLSKVQGWRAASRWCLLWVCRYANLFYTTSQALLKRLPLGTEHLFPLVCFCMLCCVATFCGLCICPSADVYQDRNRRCTVVAKHWLPSRMVVMCVCVCVRVCVCMCEKGDHIFLWEVCKM